MTNEFDHEAFRAAAGIGADEPPVTLNDLLDGIGRAAELAEQELEDARGRADSAETQAADVHAAVERAQLASAAIEHIESYGYQSDDQPWLLANRIAVEAPEHLSSYLHAWTNAEGEDAVAEWERARHDAGIDYLVAQAEQARQVAERAEQERRAAVLAEVERMEKHAGPLADVALNLIRQASAQNGVDVAGMSPDAVRDILDGGVRAAKELERINEVNEFRRQFREATKLNHDDFDRSTLTWKTPPPTEPVDLSRLAPTPTRAQELSEFRSKFREVVKRGGLLA